MLWHQYCDGPPGFHSTTDWACELLTVTWSVALQVHGVAGLLASGPVAKREEEGSIPQGVGCPGRCGSISQDSLSTEGIDGGKGV